MNIKHFEGSMKIIKIDKDICESDKIINSTINNLRKLTLISEFQIFNEKRIDYFFCPN